MLATLAILFMAAAAILGIACGINYFWKVGFKRAAGYAGLFVCVFLLFWASGLWVGASRHSWGFLTPVFAIMIMAGWLGIKYAPALWRVMRTKIGERNKD